MTEYAHGLPIPDVVDVHMQGLPLVDYTGYTPACAPQSGLVTTPHWFLVTCEACKHTAKFEHRKAVALHTPTVKAEVEAKRPAA